MDRRLTLLFAALGFTGVAFGALGAHAVKGALAGVPDVAQRLEWWATAARYHLVHALAVGVTAVLSVHTPSRLARAAAWLFLGGVLLFSGSLYALALTGQLAWAHVTPFGGLLFLSGWICVALAARPLAAR